MTTLEAENKLLIWFGNNHSFDFSTDYAKLLIVSAEGKDSNIAGLTCALNSLEKSGVVQSAEIGKKNEAKRIWVLRKPFSSLDQSVVLDLNLCIRIADIINNFREKVKNFDRLSDPLNIAPIDIVELVTIAGLTIESENKEKIS